MKEIKGPDVLFVNPCLPTLPKEVVSTPFGPSWMSAVLKKEGMSVKMLDMQVEPSLFPFFFTRTARCSRSGRVIC